ncbi:putative killer cell immunoglobulin-like receptor-like protein KIR3DX1 [Nycticebus coucang]|uniref:putative killer cell immunoglobulin-like receptor-like protein KIR3DX1 n=1 Tax=Nycticebus coucang TaxID=9470 RepID=UPI00234DC6FF|nr:putative killer cell immunoglobulin-like receptor-like protein KIR3DX1 [Nycticebus coucang]
MGRAGFMCGQVFSDVLFPPGFCLGHGSFKRMGGRDPSRPSLSAQPSHFVPLGGHVTLRCHSNPPFATFKLIRRVRSHRSEFQGALSGKSFTIKPVTSAHAGTYTCSGSYIWSPTVWSVPSNTLEIMVTGVFVKPSISAHPSSLVHAPGRVTLRCHSELVFDKFILHKKGSARHPHLEKEVRSNLPHAQADFPMDIVTPAHAGTYTCYGSFSDSPYVWSAPSDTLDLVITGKYEKPSLSTQVGPVVRMGENVTLSCSSKIQFDVYHLFRDREACDHIVGGGLSHDGTFQVPFPLGPVTPSHRGTYRCYGSLNNSFYKWSSPSDPLHLSVAETPKSTCPSPTESPSRSEAHLPQGQSSPLGVLIRLSGVVISIVIFLSAILGYWCFIKNYTTVTDMDPMGVHFPDREDVTAEETQEVIYTQLKFQTISPRRLTPSSQCPRYLSDETSTYMELTIHHMVQAEGGQT